MVYQSTVWHVKAPLAGYMDSHIECGHTFAHFAATNKFRIILKAPAGTFNVFEFVCVTGGLKHMI